MSTRHFVNGLTNSQSHRAQTERQIAFQPAIKLIADDRQTAFRQMNADLVRAPGDRFCLDERKASARLQKFEMRRAILAVAGVHLHFSEPLFVRRQFKFARPLLLLWRAEDDGQIGFLHLAALEQIKKVFDRAGTFGKKQDATRVRVEPVDVAEKFQSARRGPEIMPGDGRFDGRLQITSPFSATKPARASSPRGLSTAKTERSS